MLSTPATLVLLAVAAGPGVQRAGSSPFNVSVRVVAPMRAVAPAALELGGRAPPVSAEVNDGGFVARFTPSASVAGGACTVLVGVAGGVLRSCEQGLKGECQVALPTSGAADPASSIIVAAFVPDGAAARIVER